MIKQYSKNFWLTCIAMFLFMTGFNLILPELNEHLRSMGGEHLLGWIIILFTLSSALARPFSGKLSDYIGRKKVMLFGATISALVCLSYPLFSTIALFFLLRFLHGFSAGFLPTGATALITDLLPDNRRGRGMGVWGVFISLGIGVGQSLGSLIKTTFTLDGLFMVASAVSWLAVILFFSVAETLPENQKTSFRWGLLKIGWKDVFEPSVMPSAIVMFLSASCSGLVFVLAPEIAKLLDIPNKGIFFTFYVAMTIGVRFFTSSLSDRIGRERTLVLGMSILVISMVQIAMVTDSLSLGLAATTFGIATGISSPTIFAWTADLSLSHRRGVGAGTMFIALELGIAFGAAITFLTYSPDFKGIWYSFSLGALMALFAILYLLFRLKKRTSRSPR